MRRPLGVVVGIVLFCVLTGSAGVQRVPARDVEKIVELPKFTKEQIFEGTRKYIAQNFRSAKAVTEYENRESGTIIGKGRIKYPEGGGIVMVSWWVPFTMQVDIKEGRFRCTFTNIAIEWPASSGPFAMPAGGVSTFEPDEFERISKALLKIPWEIAGSIGQSKQRDNW